VSRAPIPVENEDQRKRVLGLIEGLNLSKQWQVTIEPMEKGRSAQQNRLYHKWVGMIASHTGASHAAVHEGLKSEFLQPRFAEFNGKVIEYRPSTTDLKVAEMTEYMDRVYAFAASDLAIHLPVPEELGRVA